MAKAYAIVAQFDTAPDVYHAAEKVRDEGYRNWDVFTPFPIHGMDDAMGLKRSKVPMFTLIGGVTGFALGNLMSWYMGAYDYDLLVGGKPYFSPIFTFPISYELTILLAAFGTLFGMFFTNKLPRHNHPIFNYKDMAALTDDKFAVMIESSDEQFADRPVRQLFKDLGATDVTAIYEDAPEEPES